MKKQISFFAVLSLFLLWANAYYEVVAFNWCDDELSDDSFRIMVYNVNGTVEDTIHENGVSLLDVVEEQKKEGFRDRWRNPSKIILQKERNLDQMRNT